MRKKVECRTLMSENLKSRFKRIAPLTSDDDTDLRLITRIVNLRKKLAGSFLRIVTNRGISKRISRTSLRKQQKGKAFSWDLSAFFFAFVNSIHTKRQCVKRRVSQSTANNLHLLSTLEFAAFNTSSTSLRSKFRPSIYLCFLLHTALHM